APAVAGREVAVAADLFVLEAGQVVTQRVGEGPVAVLPQGALPRGPVGVVELLGDGVPVRVGGGDAGRHALAVNGGRCGLLSLSLSRSGEGTFGLPLSGHWSLLGCSCGAATGALLSLIHHAPRAAHAPVDPAVPVPAHWRL